MLWWFSQCMKNHRFAQYMEIWKSFKIQLFTYLPITIIKLLNHHRREFLKSCIIFTIWRNYLTSNFWHNCPEFAFETYQFHRKLSKYNLLNKLTKIHVYPIYTNLHSFLCRFSETGIIMTSQKLCYACELQNHADFLQCVKWIINRSLACRET